MSEQATAEERSHDLEGSLLQDAQPPSSAPTGPGDSASSYLQKIANQEPQDRDFAKHILTWLMFAKRDLRPAQLQQAYTIQQTWDASNRDFNRYIESACQGLVKLQSGEKGTFVEFVCRPNLDQLLQHRLVDDNPHLTIIRTCLTCLQSDKFAKSASSPETMERLRRDHSLLNYAAMRWMEHLPDMDAKSGELAEGEKLITQFLLRGKVIKGWFRFFERISGEKVSVLHVAAMIGQVPVTKKFLETEDCKVNATTSHGRTALHLAAKHKRASVVRMLLETSVQLDIQDARGNTALHYGAITSYWNTPGSHLETVRQILSRYEKVVGGEDMRSKCTAIRNGSNKTPWDLALEAARMVEGPWPVKSDEYRLARAKMEAQYEIAKLMTFWPSDKSFKDEPHYLPPLPQVRAVYSSEAVEARLVDALTQRGRTVDPRDPRTKVEVKDLSETTPKDYVIASNEAALVDMLLEENEEDTKLLTDAYERQLCFRAWILLQTGADENHQSEDKPSALHCAVRFRSKSLVSLLLAYRASLEIRYDEKTPLDLAIELGETDIVRQLLVINDFAIRTVTTDMMSTALPLAIREGHKEIILMLSGTPLAPFIAFKETAKIGLAALALAFRMTVRRKDLQGTTVLHLALSSRARSSCYEMLLSLLQFGADVDAKDEKGRTPLMLAKKRRLYAERTLLQMYSSKSDMEHQALDHQLQQVPAHQLQQVPAYQLQQAPAYPLQQAPAHQLQQAPGHQRQQASGHQLQQAPAHQLQQAPAYPRQQAPAYPLQQAPAYPLQQAPAYPRQQASGHQHQQVLGHRRQQVPDHRRQRD